jgi:hypothetical protein
MLVNLPMLKCIECSKYPVKTKKLLKKLKKSSCFSCFKVLGGYELLSDEFIGHYILLIGYDALRDVFFYRDPGIAVPLCTIKSDVLEKARSFPGTDHDAIVVKVK